MKRVLLALCLSASLIGCRERASTKAEAAASASVPAQAPSAPPKAAPWYVGTWSGSFEAEPSTIDLDPKKGAPKAWSESDDKQGIGAGTIEVTIDEAGSATAKTTGALGALVGSAEVQDEQVALRLTPVDDAKGFSGMLLTEHRDGTLVGTLRASTADSLVVRRAAVTLAKKR